MTEHEAYIALNLISGIGPVTIRRLVEFAGSAAAVFDADPREFRAVRGIGGDMLRKLIDGIGDLSVDSELRRADELGVKLIALSDTEYPAQLREIYAPPSVLYLRGDCSVLKRDGVAVIGTRQPTLYGQETARRLSFDLAHAGITVVSGLALGVDAEAHRGALQAEGTTVAVLGSALDRLAPVENSDLARSIVQKGGAVVSEFPFGRSADRTTFPLRNRVVSGLSRGVLVIEAGTRSGTFITVDQALEQGRSVMAVPGRIDSVNSRGCHRLLRSGARLVESLDDILDEITGLRISEGSPEDEYGDRGFVKDGLSAEEQCIVALLADGEIKTDDLIRKTGFAAGAVGALLVGLELKRYIRVLPGQVVKSL